MKKKEERMEKQMAEITAKNKLLAEPLQKAQEEVEELKKELSNYEKDKETLRVSYFGALSGGFRERNDINRKWKWATWWQNQQNDCVPSKDSDQPAQSDQSLCCSFSG